jgi:hypothetical protein
MRSQDSERAEVMRVIHNMIPNRRGTVVARQGIYVIVEWDGEGSEFLPLSNVHPDPNYL